MAQTNDLYVSKASKYLDFIKASFSWDYIERPAFDLWLKNRFDVDTKILDVGCGSGRLMKYFIDKGVPEENISGLDNSQEMLSHAKTAFIDSTLVVSSATRLLFPDHSFDLVVSNMVMHLLDKEEFCEFLKEAKRVLNKEGILFFVDTNPLSTSKRRSQLDTWISVMAPWGEPTPVYVHDFQSALQDSAIVEGFDCIKFEVLPLDEGGKLVDEDEYARYSKHPCRVAALLVKK